MIYNSYFFGGTVHSFVPVNIFVASMFCKFVDFLIYFLIELHNIYHLFLVVFEQKIKDEWTHRKFEYETAGDTG